MYLHCLLQADAQMACCILRACRHHTATHVHKLWLQCGVLWLSPTSIIPLICAGGIIISYIALRQISEGVLGKAEVAPMRIFTLNALLYSLLSAVCSSLQHPQLVQQISVLMFVLLLLQGPTIVWLHILLMGHSTQLLKISSTMTLLLLLVIVPWYEDYFKIREIFVMGHFVQLQLGNSLAVATTILLSLFAVPAVLIQIQQLEAQSYSRNTISVALGLYTGFVMIEALGHWRNWALPGVAEIGQLFIVLGYQRSIGHQLIAAYKRSQKMNDLRSKMMDSLSHELRTPLGVVKGYLEMMYNGTLGELTPMQLKAVGTSLENIIVETEMIDDLLLSSYFEKGYKLHSEIVSIPGILSDVVSSQQSRHSEKEMVVRLSNEKAVVVEGDAVLLRKLFEKIIHNAFVYAPSESELLIESRQTSKEAVIKITDHGPGISPDIIEMIGESFTQASAGDTDQMQGLGLGLSIAKEIVQMHGGRMELSNAPQKQQRSDAAPDQPPTAGLQVHIFLPLNQ